MNHSAETIKWHMESWKELWKESQILIRSWRNSWCYQWDSACLRCHSWAALKDLLLLRHMVNNKINSNSRTINSQTNNRMSSPDYRHLELNLTNNTKRDPHPQSSTQTNNNSYSTWAEMSNRGIKRPMQPISLSPLWLNRDHKRPPLM